jgi:hypothetical protein
VTSRRLSNLPNREGSYFHPKGAGLKIFLFLTMTDAENANTKGENIAIYVCLRLGSHHLAGSNSSPISILSYLDSPILILRHGLANSLCLPSPFPYISLTCYDTYSLFSHLIPIGCIERERTTGSQFPILTIGSPFLEIPLVSHHAGFEFRI